ncbi:helix-turn-helix transcriptional regulator [Lactobacillus acetotolerans]|uniref:helix-turn-helix transcriptional regulator n=1 Tax=Lactobacillus acetotolerans TaxID=1600 RepID=UPI001F492ED8|nr:helix-turn-helix transcriptional regulator [Lactobacillus acetotolerans]
MKNYKKLMISPKINLAHGNKINLVRGRKINLIRGKKINLVRGKRHFHEVVKPIDPLPVWLYIFNKLDEKGYIAPHWHYGIELSFTMNGKMDDFTINGKHYCPTTGRILVVNTQEIHSINTLLRPTDLLLSIIFPFQYVSRLYPDIEHKELDINDPDQFNSQQQLAYVQLQGLLTQFVYAYESKLDLRYIYLQKILDQVLLLLLTEFTTKKRQKGKSKRRKIYIIDRLQFITQFVNNHYKEKISLDEIANKCNVTKEYLSRFFKREMEMTVNVYINNVRAQYAHEELLSKKTNLTEVALDNGFSGVRTMNRTFKKLYGKTASQYKHELKHKIR